MTLLPMFLAAATFTVADAAPFDLTGPRLEAKVTRAGKTLAISQVPNLQPGDRIWLHPELPKDQSVRYLMIVTFLRGSTNPPPEKWFTKIETWNKGVVQEGVVVTVPQDAQQALIFFAPETGGDFSTLRNAVRGKPGAFVRASQDLVQAGLDRSRLDKYLAAVKKTSDTDPDALHDRSAMLARSLNIKLDQECFDKPSQEQAPCLMRNTDQLVLDDGHTSAMVNALTSGSGADLIGQIGSTKLGGAGAYSAYVGAVLDVARLMANFHTAQYQYIPALALPNKAEFNLRLNNPPSFHNPKSVLVAALPAIESAQMPPLRNLDAEKTLCLQQPSLVLPADGAPLAFSTDYARDFLLHIQPKSGQPVDVPASPDPTRGGFVVDAKALKAANLSGELTGTLRGYWGFQPYVGPAFTLYAAHPEKWTLAGDDETALIVGRKDSLHLHSENTACVDQVTLRDAKGKTAKATWKALKKDEMEVEVPLDGAEPGEVTMLVKQHGVTKADEISLRSYAEAGHLAGFMINQGDQQGLLEGTRLDEVASVEFHGAHFAPAGLTRSEKKDLLRMATSDKWGGDPPKDEKLVAKVALKDGRTMDVQTTVEPPRPKLELLSKSVQPANAKGAVIKLGNQDDVPQDARLTFFVKVGEDSNFQKDDKIEVATADGSATTKLGVADGGLTWQDAHTVIAVLDPVKAFGASAFGALRFRPVDRNGAAGDWQPLANLVRVPVLNDVHCPDTPDKQCTLGGSNLFLIDSVAADSQFTKAAPVPVGFAGTTLEVPRPNGTLLYIKLRDNPNSVNRVSLPVLPE